MTSLTDTNHAAAASLSTEDRANVLYNMALSLALMARGRNAGKVNDCLDTVAKHMGTDAREEIERQIWLFECFECGNTGWIDEEFARRNAQLASEGRPQIRDPR